MMPSGWWFILLSVFPAVLGSPWLEPHAAHKQCESNSITDVQIFGYSVDAVLASSMFQTMQRDLSIVDFFSGIGSIWKTGRDRGWAAAGFDRADDPRCDFDTPEGFWIALSLLARVREGGLVTIAPCCSMMVWVSSAVHKRSDCNDHLGDIANAKVRASNHGAAVSIFIFAVALLRGIRTMLENPPNSSYWKLPFVKHAMRRAIHMGLTNSCDRQTVTKCAYDLHIRDGQRSSKKYRFPVDKIV